MYACVCVSWGGEVGVCLHIYIKRLCVFVCCFPLRHLIQDSRHLIDWTSPSLTHTPTPTPTHDNQTSGLQGDYVLAANDLMLVPIPARKEGVAAADPAAAATTANAGAAR